MFVIESCKYWYEKEGGKCIEKTISQKKKMFQCQKESQSFLPVNLEYKIYLRPKYRHFYYQYQTHMHKGCGSN